MCNFGQGGGGGGGGREGGGWLVGDVVVYITIEIDSLER